jgi:protein phosphatase
MDPENTPDNAGGRKSIRLLRPSIVVLCGPAACGKSTFAQKHFRPTQIISSDWARAHVADDERDQRFNTQAFALVHFLIEQRLTLNRLCVVDSTALTAQARRGLLDLAKKFPVPTTLMVFNVPLETCVARDEKRERSVGRAVIERQYQAFAQSKAAIREEGFDQVVEFHDDDLEKAQIEVLFRPVAQPTQREQRPGTASPRSPERSVQLPKPRPNVPGNNRVAVAGKPVSPPIVPVAPPRTADGSGPTPVPKGAGE